jgi:DNA mismatch repair protein MutL
MPQIFVLPDHIASQIAAGEVVERPASVVKELIENSIDAGATKIVIDIKEGSRYIRVADNGCGMEPADASLAFQRHATSKLTSANDLWSLHTLGFRGEALPSIAAVSRLTCSTRTDKNEVGTKVFCMDGAMTVSETGCAKGTIIEVEELFYNVPARLSFLKKSATEFAHILDIVQSLAISYPNIAFELSLDGTLRLKTLGINELDGAIAESNFFGGQQSFITLSGKDGVLGLEIEGRLVSPKSFRGDRKGVMTIVNKRPVRCALAYKALDYAYADLIPRGRYPLAVLHLKVSPSELDINIHPTKKEIRYSRGNDVYLFMQRQIVRALRNEDDLKFNFFGAGNSANGASSTANTEQKNNVAAQAMPLNFEPLTDGSQARTIPQSALNTTLFDRSPYTQEKGKQLSLREVGETVYFDRLAGTNTPTISSSSDSASLNDAASLENVLESSLESSRVNALTVCPSASLPLDWRLAGYLANTYILLETAEGLSIVEQHIAHERVLYEKLLANKSETARQHLLISLPLQLSHEQKSVLKENIAELSEQGFEFEIERDSIACTQVPVEFAHKDYVSIVQNILQELAESSMVNPKLDIVKSIACQSAIKNGMFLADDQIIELLNEWYKTPRNETCPHGRPIQLSFSRDKLFQMFHPA